VWVVDLVGIFFSTGAFTLLLVIENKLIEAHIKETVIIFLIVVNIML
jgi:hypothetical protein